MENVLSRLAKKKQGQIKNISETILVKEGNREQTMKDGYIKIWRKMLRWRWFQNANVLQVFLYLLLKASHSELKIKGHTIKRGQAIVSRSMIMKDLGLSEQTVRTCLKKLLRTEEISIKLTSKFSIITLLKYDTYQQSPEKINQQPTSKKMEKLTSQKSTKLTSKKTVKVTSKEAPPNLELSSICRDEEIKTNQQKNDKINQPKINKTNQQKNSQSNQQNQSHIYNNITRNTRNINELSTKDGVSKQDYVFVYEKRARELQNLKLSSLRKMRCMLTELSQQYPATGAEYAKEINLIDELIAKRLIEMEKKQNV